MPDETLQNNTSTTEQQGATNVEAPAATQSTDSNQTSQQSAGESNAEQTIADAAKTEFQETGKVSFSAMQNRLKGVTTSPDEIKLKMADAAKKIDNEPEIESAQQQPKKIEQRTVQTPKPTSQPASIPNQQSQANAKQEQIFASRRQQLKDIGLQDTDLDRYTSMSNDAFKSVLGHLTENKKLKEEIETVKKNATSTAPLDSYSHPEGYTLDSQFKQVDRVANVARAVVNHWTEQLVKIQAGQEWQDIEYDDQGNLFLGKKYAADANAQNEVTRLYYKAMQADSQYSHQRDTFVQNFKQRHQSDIASVKALEDKFFPGYDDPNSDAYKKTKPLRDQAINLIPEAWRNHPVMSLAGKLVANNSLLYNSNKTLLDENTALKAEIATLKGKAAGNSQQPTKDEFVTTGSTNQRPQVSFSDMKARLAGHR